MTDKVVIKQTKDKKRNAIAFAFSTDNWDYMLDTGKAWCIITETYLILNDSGWTPPFCFRILIYAIETAVELDLYKKE